MRFIFVWIATDEGLHRYDGYDFVIYRHDPGDPGSLGSDFVSFVCEDHTGVLWVGLREGLDRFDRDTGQFIHYRHDAGDPASLSNDVVRAIYEDRAGALWVGSEGGLDRLERESGQFTHYRHDPSDAGSLSDDVVRVIYEDQEGVLWVGTEDGLNRFDRDAGRFVRYRHDPSDAYSLSDSSIWAIYQDQAGTLWVGTEGGLNRFDRATERFTHYQHDETDAYSLSHDSVHAIRQAGDGKLWVGTFGGGLDLFDPRTEQFTHHRQDPANPQGLSGDLVRSIFEDDAGTLWVVTAQTSINRLDPAKQRFSHYRNDPDNPNSLSDNAVWGIYEDHTGLIWLGTTSGGLNSFDPRSKQFTHYRHDPDDPYSLGNGWIMNVYEDHLGTLWIATEGAGLESLNRETGQFTHYRHDPADPHSLGYDSIWSIYEDRAGTLWIGTGSTSFEAAGLDKFDRETGQFTHYPHDPADPHSLSNNVVTTIYEDRTGALWVCTLDGVNKFDRSSGKFTRYKNDPDDPQSLSYDIVPSMYEDEASILWFATYGGGISRFDPTTETFRHYDERDGLPDDSTYAILEDAAGYLWISTNLGLSRFDPETETFKNYNVLDGLQGNEFNVFAALESSSGEMYFGGPNGFNVFDPAQVQDNPYVPPIVISDFQLFNASVQAGDDSPLQHAIEDTQEIVLSYEDRVFSFELVALNYTFPEKNQYAYMLEGFDKDWTYRDADRRFATYTNLDPGKYVFRVKGSNNDGVWNEVGTAIKITVTPPFWRTWWFYTLCALCVLCVFGAIFKYRTSQLHRALAYERLEVEKARVETENARLEVEKAHVETENARLEAELDVTYRLQQMLLPSKEELARLEGLDVAGFMQPAEEVGGDYYEALQFGEQVKLGIGDVTGHGLESGVVMLMLQTAVRTLLIGGVSDVRQFIRILNRVLHANMERMQVDKSMSLVLLDYQAGLMKPYVSGQHEQLIVVRQDGKVELLDTLDLGFPLGLEAEIDQFVGASSVELHPGDGIVLYSDGFTEAENAVGEFYGLERLCQAVSRHWVGTAEEIKEAIVSDARAFIGEHTVYDDLALLVVKQK